MKLKKETKEETFRKQLKKINLKARVEKLIILHIHTLKIFLMFFKELLVLW